MKGKQKLKVVRTSRSLGKLLPQRSKTSHKGSAGKSLIIAGSSGMSGAARLCAEACARVGSGYVYLMTLGHAKKSKPDFLTLVPTSRNINAIPAAIACGPGLGKSRKAKRLVLAVLGSKHRDVVLDADALNLISKMQNPRLRSSWILTPHEAELARLLKKTPSWVHSNRRAAVLAAQKRFGCIVLLKGHRTLIADKNGMFEIRTGNPALAKAGTGDVLTGMITGLLAQGLEPIDATVLAATIHGEMADLWVRTGHDELSLLASDLIQMLPKALSRLRKSK